MPVALVLDLQLGTGVDLKVYNEKREPLYEDKGSQMRAAMEVMDC